jgi:hypothetical protein
MKPVAPRALDAPKPAEISKTARERLAPELIALLERGPGAGRRIRARSLTQD